MTLPNTALEPIPIPNRDSGFIESSGLYYIAVPVSLSSSR